MSDIEKNGGIFGLFRGLYVWSGIAMAVGGYLAEELIGAEHGFEFLMFFGGFNLGMGLMQNLNKRKALQSKPIQTENSSPDC